MSLRVALTGEAEAEIAEAAEWYEQCSKGLGTEFLRAVEAAILSAARTPLIYSSWKRGSRRVLLRRFPYAIFYTIEQDEITIFACYHGKRNPKILLRRIPAN